MLVYQVGMQVVANSLTKRLAHAKIAIGSLVFKIGQDWLPYAYNSLKNFEDIRRSGNIFFWSQSRLGRIPSPLRSAKSQVGQIAKISRNFSVFRGLLGRYASVTDHIAPGCSPHVYYEPAKDEDHRPTGDRVGLARNPGLKPTSPLLSTTVAIH